MRNKIPLYFILGISILVAVLHISAISLHLYWRLEMYDKLVHLVGGFLVAFICLSIIYVKRMPNVRISHLLLMGIFASLVIGVGWEIFEFQADITSFKEVDYWSNNSSDIVADVVGGLVATWYFAQRFSLSKK